MYAVNWTTGLIEWKYESPNNAYETPYTDANGTTVSSWNGGILVADGKLYDYNTEHSPTQPITRGWKLHCVNATTGDGIWNITAFSGSRDFRGAVADGYLAFDNFYDGTCTCSVRVRVLLLFRRLMLVFRWEQRSLLRAV